MTLRTLIVPLQQMQRLIFLCLLCSYLNVNAFDTFSNDYKLVPCENTFVTSNNSPVICKDGTSDNVTFNNTGNELVGVNYTYFITNTSGDIQVIMSNAIYDFDILPTGDFEVYGVSYDGTLNVNVGDNIADASSWGSICSTISSNFLSFSIIQISAPGGPNSQSFCSINIPTIGDLFAIGTDIKWYSNQNSTSPLLNTTFLVDGADYFATQTVGGCESAQRLQVIVNIDDPNPPTGSEDQYFCLIDQPNIGDLVAFGSNIQWYEEENSFSPLAPTVLLLDGEDYYATQTVNGCESDTRLLIYASVDNPNPPTGAATQFFCAIDNPTLNELIVTGTNIIWYENNIDDTPMMSTTNLIDGEDYFAAQVVDGCESVDRLQVIVAIDDPLPPSGELEQSFCLIDSPQIIDIEVQGQNITWYDTPTSNSPLQGNVLLASGEDYFATQTINGCESDTRFQVIISIMNPPAPTGLPVQDFCAIDNPIIVNLDANGASVIWYESINSTDPLAPNATLIHGEDYFGAQIIDGCESINRLQVTVNINDPLAPNGDDQQLFCSIDSPTINDIITDGTSVTWYSSISSNVAIDNSTPLVNGTEYFATQIIGGCESDTRFAVTVTIEDPTIPTGSNTQSFCAIDLPILNDISVIGNNIIWYETENSTTPLDNTTSLVDGESYFATQNVNSCESISRLEVVVTINDPDAPVGNSTQLFCSSENPTITDLEGVGNNVLWYETQNSNIPLVGNTVLVDGQNYFATQELNGCESDTRLEVTVQITDAPNSALILNASQLGICTSGSSSIEINNSEVGVSYQLLQLPTSTTIGVPVNGTGSTISLPTNTISETTTYEVLASNSMNPDCNSILDNAITITVDGLNEMANAGNNELVCNENNIQLSGNEPTGGLGTWSQVSGPNSALIIDENLFNTDVTGLIAGSYVFEWIIENGACTGSFATSDQVTIEVVNITANTNISNVNTVNGEDGIIGICIEGASNPLLITWLPNDGELNAVPSITCSEYYEISGLSAGQYDISIEDANGCTTIIPALQVENPDCSQLEITNVITSDETCFGNNDGSITIETSNAIGEITYDIGLGQTPVMTTNTNYTFNNLPPGEYDVSIVDERGCEASFNSNSIIINSPLELEANITTTNPSVIGGSDGFICITTIGGTAPFNISSTCGVAIDGPTSECNGDFIIQNLASGACEITITDDNGCIYSSIHVLNDPLCDDFAIVDVVVEDLLCYNDNSGSIFISINDGLSPYQYSKDGGVTFENNIADSYVFNDLAAGEYDIVVQDNAGCAQSWSSTVTVLQPDSLIADIDTQNGSCEGLDNGSVSLFIEGGTAPYTVDWSNAETGLSIENLSPENYAYTVTDANGCNIIENIDIQEISSFSVEVEINGSTIEDRPIFEGESVELIAVTDAVNPTYLWTPSDGLSVTDESIVVATPTETTIYTVMVTSEDGCAITSSFEVNVTSKNIILFPNTFSPNQDGNNDQFYPVIEGDVVVKDFKVFNRWGQKLFDNPSITWDGTYKGKSQPQDTYVYIIQYQIENQPIQTVSGDIVLIR